MNQNKDISAPLKVAFYIRVSTEDQVEKYGISMQKEALNALLKSRGKLPDGKDTMLFAGNQHVYIDEGISGTIPLDERPAFARLKEAIVLAPKGQNPFDVVAVYKIDRFARKLKILLDVIDFFEDHKVKFLSSVESIDTSTPFGKAILGIIGVIAELEIETMKKRTQDGRKEAIKGGTVMGSSAVFGYEKDENKHPKILEAEAKVVRDVFDMFINKKLSFNNIAKRLTELEVPTPDASALIHKKRKGNLKKKNPISFWRPDAIRKMLQKKIYIGKYYYGKYKNNKRLPEEEWKLSPFKVDPIIDILTFEKAQRLIAHTKHSKKKSTSSHTYLLSGLLRCNCCYEPERDKGERVRWVGDRKEIKKGSGKYTYSYKCGRKNRSKHHIKCTALPFPAKEIEEYIVTFVKRLLKDPLATYNYQLKLQSTQAEIKQLHKRRSELVKLTNSIPQQKENLKAQHEINIINTDQLKERFKELNERQERHNKELDKIDEQIARNTLSKSYIQCLDLFSTKYAKALETKTTNRTELYDILHMLIEEVIVFTRPVTKKDKVAGKRTSKQEMPHRIQIKFKLPTDIMQKEFGAKKSEW